MCTVIWYVAPNILIVKFRTVILTANLVTVKSGVPSSVLLGCKWRLFSKCFKISSHLTLYKVSIKKISYNIFVIIKVMSSAWSGTTIIFDSISKFRLCSY